MGPSRWIVAGLLPGLLASTLLAGGCEPSHELASATSRPASTPVLAGPWHVGEEGIELAFTDDMLFDPGSAKLTDRGTRAIRDAASGLLACYRDNIIRVRAVVDYTPEPTGEMSKANLSWMRAFAVAEVLRAAGIRDENIEAIGINRPSIASPTRPFRHGVHPGVGILVTGHHKPANETSPGSEAPW